MQSDPERDSVRDADAHAVEHCHSHAHVTVALTYAHAHEHGHAEAHGLNRSPFDGHSDHPHSTADLNVPRRLFEQPE